MLVLLNIMYIGLAYDVLAPLFHLDEPDDAHWFFLMLAAELLGIVLVDWPRAQPAKKYEPDSIHALHSISEKPRMAPSGVRRSWETMETNLDLS